MIRSSTALTASPSSLVDNNKINTRGAPAPLFLCYNIHVTIIFFTMFGFTPEAEILNARLAMLGFVIAVGTYATTGQIIPGVF